MFRKSRMIHVVRLALVSLLPLSVFALPQAQFATDVNPHATVLLLPARAEQSPTKYLPSIKERERYSDVICSATVVRTYATGDVVQLEGEERSVWMAEARVDRIFKGNLGSQIIEFSYYGWGPNGPRLGLSPPIAEFRSDVRYVLFLAMQNSALVVTVPFYKAEIQIASNPAPLAGSNSDLALARELIVAIESAPQTTGRMATHYFDWIAELVERKSIPLVEPFLISNDPLVRYQAAWWLSFREVNETVTDELKMTMQDKSIEAWARSGARDRLRDIAEGKFIP